MQTEDNMFRVILLMIILGCDALITEKKHDSGSFETGEGTRVRRSTDMEDHSAQLPSQHNTGQLFSVNPNLQASYFVGQCVLCPPGDHGPRGVPGMQGMPGRDGRDQLIIGPIGDHVIQNPATSVPEAGSGTPSAGVTYTRWGRTSCPSTSQLVYQGVMGGSHYNQKGSGVNFLCLPLQPTFADDPSYGNGGANIYGVEYNSNLYTSESQNIQNSEAPCVVCLSPNKDMVLTIPGTNTCLGTQDWTLEYQGYMMSSASSHNKSEFVCIDQNAEGIPRTGHNNNEAILYVADAKCSSSGGGLPCPPYVDGYDVLCAVCTL